MSEPTISLTTLFAISCWTLGLIGAVVNMFIGPDLGAIACGFFVAGGCLSVRSAITRSALSSAEMFQLGEEAQRRRTSGPRGV